MSDPRRDALRLAFDDPALFSQYIVGTRLRGYQADAIRAIARAIANGDGGAFALMFARQAGKNELSAHLEAWALTRYQRTVGAQIVKAAPTLRPQLTNSIVRLQRVLSNPLTRRRWRREHGGVRLGEARVLFLSGSPTANVVGATASLALELDEAQDIDPDKHDRDFAPMASTTNAVRVYYGTAWTEDTLLARTIADLRARPETRRRVFVVPWGRVAEEVPAYGRFVESERARLGADHPLFRTQYDLKPISGAGRLFTSQHLAQMRANHIRLRSPRDGETYVAGVDLAGGELSSTSPSDSSARPDRDSTVVTIARVVPVEIAEGLSEPRVEIVEHCWWTGRDHRTQYAGLLDLLGRLWRVARVSVDATGLGAGLASFLGAALGSVVDPVTFTAPRKSQLGFALLAAAGSGRLRMYAEPEQSDEAREFWREVEAARREVGSSGLMGWRVPESEGHDDFVASLALAVAAAGNVTLAPAAGETLRRPRYQEGARW